VSRDNGGGAMERQIRDERFNPGKYGMIFCPGCKGAGYAFLAEKGRIVCKLCGGFGLIKKDEKNPPKDSISYMH